MPVQSSEREPDTDQLTTDQTDRQTESKSLSILFKIRKYLVSDHEVGEEQTYPDLELPILESWSQDASRDTIFKVLILVDLASHLGN